MLLQFDTANLVSTQTALPLLLVEEFSHRVVNEFTLAVSSLRSRARNACTPEARKALEEAASRLTGYAEVHRALQVPRTTKTIDLADHLEGICKVIAAATLQERGIFLSLAGDTAEMASGRAWRVALIVSELITNAARHGLVDGGGAILIHLKNLGDVMCCQVIDNGGVRFAPIPSRGHSVVRRLAEELGGDVAWTFSPEGTRVELIIPLNNGDETCA